MLMGIYSQCMQVVKRGLLYISALCLCAFTINAKTEKENPDYRGYLVATDYVPADGKTDVTDAIQRLIDSNPNRTILFPDGVYLISRSILTPAHPQKSVHLVLCNYARFQATGDWKEGGAVVRLGASHPANNINLPGSTYGLTGGIIDGAGVADGISIDGGRETRVKEVSIKNTRIGIHIKHGANSGSSDSDIMDVNIVGNNQPDAIGVLVEGFDNTLSNMRIASVNKGVWLKSGGNSLRNIHPLYIFRDTQDYESSCGFVIERWDNWLNYCYSDQMATGFKLNRGVKAKMTDCFCLWYSGKVPSQTVISAEGPFESHIHSIRVSFHKDCKNTRFMKAEKGGKGKILHPELNSNYQFYAVEQEYIMQ